MSRSGRAAVALGVAAVAWVALAGLRPGVTYHLAPALVTWVYPYVRLAGERSSRRLATVAVLIGTVTALVLTGLLDALGWLEGPALVGGDATGESALVVAGAMAIGLGVAVTRTRGPERRAGHDAAHD